MDWKKFLCAAGAGALLGYAIRDRLSHQLIKPENALKLAKEAFKQLGPVSGSWIYMKPEEITKNSLNYTVYRGGITRTIDHTNIQFEFYVDANTGSIIEVTETA
ncbi:Peptidase propeptide and YPEB domain protein [Paraliobacillus sp. PM-2]|uniref:PepSY domain-containing protein n=1 Tax=Paraliobacillus sp. PM-2 TaxID=1462524 RepID=UPI00061C3486|nr:PepSY domain-containing protein [Paraliobacillus sp. PM-2]CQR48174.1 Peptidase propeptide and YPEB domain protein [Paraliobacillus sp. PM-2]